MVFAAALVTGRVGLALVSDLFNVESLIGVTDDFSAVDVERRAEVIGLVGDFAVDGIPFSFGLAAVRVFVRAALKLQNVH